MVALELLPIHYGRVEALELRKSKQQRTTRKRHHEVWHKLARNYLRIDLCQASGLNESKGPT